MGGTSHLALKFVNLGEFKRWHPNPLTPLRDPGRCSKGQLQTVVLLKKTRNDFAAALLFFRGLL